MSSGAWRCPGGEAPRCPSSEASCRNGLRVVTHPHADRPDRWRSGCSWASARDTRTRRTPACRTSSSTSSSRARATTRSPARCREAVEGCGGAVNASTDRELTVYSAKVPAAAAQRGLDVVAELVLRPLLRKRDLSAEKPVIVDEIRMYVDSPGDHVFTLFDETLFGDHPLGREIAGTPRSVRRATHEGVVGHWRRWYQPRHLVLAAAGAVTHDGGAPDCRGLVRSAHAMAG